MLGQIIEERYLIEAELGEGAMGCVYRARHIKVGRQVAIKVMHPELARVSTIVERFAREARIAAKLNHPNLIGVLDVGMTETRLPLIVLELAPGRSLYQHMDGPMQRDRVVNIVRQLLLGLDHAHAAGLVHRDLKPDNILLETRADGSEIPRIVDFGIAVCNTGDDPIANRRLTEANTVIGTPCYMAPEQAMAKDVDQRTDLFALGVITYELLAGMPPFPGAGVDVALANTHMDPPSITERAGIVVDPLLEAFALKLMARQPAKRFQSAHSALQMLDVIGADRILAARALSADSVAPAPVQPPTPVRVKLPANCDAMSTHPVTAVTRVELLPYRPRPARRRAAAGLALAVAAMTAVVGWSFRGDSTAGAPRIEASFVSGASELAVPELTPPSRVEVATLIVTPEPVAVVASAPAPRARVAKPVAGRPARPAVQQTVVAAAREEAPTTVSHAPIVDTSAAVAARYVEVGKALRGEADELWARYRLIRINDALATEQSRRETLVALAEIERAIRK